jgi:protein gp37
MPYKDRATYLRKQREFYARRKARAQSSGVNRVTPQSWWGVSVENRKHGLPRVEQLRAANVAMRFLSVEPMLEDLAP